MIVRLTLAAQADLENVLAWYEGQAPQVVPRFVTAYQALLARLEENPRQFPRTGSRAGVRRAGFTEFPYGLFYRLGKTEVEVFACMHARRHPGHWQRRI